MSFGPVMVMGDIDILGKFLRQEIMSRMQFLVS